MNLSNEQRIVILVSEPQVPSSRIYQYPKSTLASTFPTSHKLLQHNTTNILIITFNNNKLSTDLQHISILKSNHTLEHNYSYIYLQTYRKQPSVLFIILPYLNELTVTLIQSGRVI